MNTPSEVYTLQGLQVVSKWLTPRVPQLHLECSSKEIFIGGDLIGGGRGYGSWSIGRVAQIGTGMDS